MHAPSPRCDVSIHRPSAIYHMPDQPNAGEYARASLTALGNQGSWTPGGPRNLTWNSNVVKASRPQMHPCSNVHRGPAGPWRAIHVQIGHHHPDKDKASTLSTHSIPLEIRYRYLGSAFTHVPGYVPDRWQREHGCSCIRVRQHVNATMPDVGDCFRSKSFTERTHCKGTRRIRVHARLVQDSVP
ncbi:hypothetical protein OG21DRAFT_1206914 [Imleria badia]|nr:hypothetical protein OG21DRAFT_1206914 [Imleria badia]